MVLGHLPDMYKAKGRLLLHHLRNAGVKWSNKGEIISRSGDVIPGSNAVDLVREALVGSRRMKQNYGEPSGGGEFLQTLREANVPRSLFGKKKTLRQLQEDTCMLFLRNSITTQKNQEVMEE